MYSGVKISEVVESNKGIGGVMALLWFQVIMRSVVIIKKYYEKRMGVSYEIGNQCVIFFRESFRIIFVNSWSYV